MANESKSSAYMNDVSELKYDDNESNNENEEEDSEDTYESIYSFIDDEDAPLTPSSVSCHAEYIQERLDGMQLEERDNDGDDIAAANLQMNRKVVLNIQTDTPTIHQKPNSILKSP